MKIIIIIALLAVLIALAFAVYFMLSRPAAAEQNDGDAAQARSRQMARALTWRIALSVCVFAGLLIAYALGWIQPHSAL